MQKLRKGMFNSLALLLLMTYSPAHSREDRELGSRHTYRRRLQQVSRCILSRESPHSHASALHKALCSCASICQSDLQSSSRLPQCLPAWSLPCMKSDCMSADHCSLIRSDAIACTLCLKTCHAFDIETHILHSRWACYLSLSLSLQSLLMLIWTQQECTDCFSS